jgi:hypothetical protein
MQVRNALYSTRTFWMTILNCYGGGSHGLSI